MGNCSDLCRREILLCAETRQRRGQRFRCARRGMRGNPLLSTLNKRFPRAHRDMAVDLVAAWPD